MLGQGVVIFSTFLVYVSTWALAGLPNVDHVSKGFSASDMHWVDNQGQFLQSLSGNFIASFETLPANSNKYYLCVKFAPINLIVWTANRDVPVTKMDNLVFQDDGNLLLFGPRGLPVWSSRTNGTDAQTLQLQDSGNLVLLDSKNKTIWESFSQPTDTLVPGQRLKPGMSLVSRKSTTDFSGGPYSLALDPNSLELLVDLGGSELVPYWMMNTDRRSIMTSASQPAAYASFDSRILTVYGNSSTPLSSLVIRQSPDNTTIGILVLDVKGNLISKASSSGGQLSDTQVIEDNCMLPSSCGPYGVCSSGGQCSCPMGLNFLNPQDATKGCTGRMLSVDFCRSRQDVEFTDMGSSLSYFANQYVEPAATARSLDECKKLCAKNCNCSTGFFNGHTQSCYLSLTQKFGSFENGNGSFQSFIKAPRQASKKRENYLMYGIIACSVGLILCSVGAFAWWYRRRLRAAKDDEEDGFLDSIPGLPTRFTFKELQVATSGFSKKLGGGGFGSVYEGTLPDKSKVAVKQLESIGQGKKEFRAEVATIGSIHHVNLVRLRGFCSEGNHRLLVYEFLARGSLDKSLFVDSNSSMNSEGVPLVLDWDTRYNIALGTARGLAYLHEDCRERIIHCDIKPENILLDEHFTAKVSDFGLAKLMNREQSHVFTTMRGTRGYLAPEWLLNTAISEKSDVYSFGMVLLEIVTGRKNFDPSESSEKWYIPAYAFRQAEVGSLAELLDSRLKGHANEEQVVKTVKIALWCIQEEMHVRPSTGKVVQMLEGNVPVPDPPLSSQLAVRLHARMADAVSERDRYSISEFNSQDLLSACYLSGPR